MKQDGWKSTLVRRLIKNTAPEDMISIVDLFLPPIVNALSKAQLTAFIKLLLDRHLGLLLKKLNREERAELLNELLPIVAREFQLQDVELVPVIKTLRDQAR